MTTQNADDRGDDFTPDDEDLDAIVASTRDDDDDADDGAAAKAAEEAKAKEEAEAKAAEEAKKKELEARIPKERFDEAVGRERKLREAAEAKLREAEEKAAAANKGLDPEKVEAEIAGLEEKLDKAVTDGDKTAAAAIRKEIRAKMQSIATAEATRQAAYATAVAVERVRYDAAVSSLEGKYPAMNPDHADYDEAVTQELIELKAAYEATGMGSTDALIKAAKYVFKGAVAPAKKEEVDPEAKAAAEKEVAEKAAKAKEDAIRRAQELRDKQPPKAGGKAGDKGKEAVPKSVARMTDKEFEALPDEEKRRLRGDLA